MRCLLDTHTFLWFIAGSDELSFDAKSAILDPKNEKFVSIASFWEIAIKLNIGRLEIDIPFKDLKNQVLINGFQYLPILFEDTLRLSTLALHHRDPFDRILISQALQHQLTIISKDGEFHKYPCKVVW